MISDETIGLIQNKSELLLVSMFNENLVKIKNSFKKNTAKEYLPFMQKVWTSILERRGNVCNWHYVKSGVVDDLYVCEYLINFSKSHSFISIYIDRRTMNLVRFDFTGEKSTFQIEN